MDAAPGLSVLQTTANSMSDRTTMETMDHPTNKFAAAAWINYVNVNQNVRNVSNALLTPYQAFLKVLPIKTSWCRLIRKL